MCEEIKYNGWTNRETWATNLHIDNDEGLSAEMTEKVEELIKDHQDDTEEITYALSMWTENWITNLVSPEWWRDEVGCEMSVGAERIREDIGSLWRVNWREIAKSHPLLCELVK
jgi:hypothetical protein